MTPALTKPYIEGVFKNIQLANTINTQLKTMIKEAHKSLIFWSDGRIEKQELSHVLPWHFPHVHVKWEG